MGFKEPSASWGLISTKRLPSHKALFLLPLFLFLLLLCHSSHYNVPFKGACSIRKQNKRSQVQLFLKLAVQCRKCWFVYTIYLCVYVKYFRPPFSIKKRGCVTMARSDLSRNKCSRHISFYCARSLLATAKSRASMNPGTLSSCAPVFSEGVQPLSLIHI